MLRSFFGEFMDQRWLPASLHATLRDVLGFHLRVTLGYYYAWCARETAAQAAELGVRRVAELGAGSAGFSETLAALVTRESQGLHVEVSDLHPQPERYRELQRAYPGVLSARVTTHDFLREPPVAADAIVVMSAAFHHVPVGERARVLTALRARRVMIFESVTFNLASMLGCAVGFLPALATPLYFWRTRNGRWRRVFWCWIVPVAPFMVAWDGVVSCLRCWTELEWRRALTALGVEDRAITMKRRRFSYVVSW